MATSVWRKFKNIDLSGKLRLKKNAEITRDDQVVSITAAAVGLIPYIHGNGRTVAFNRAAGIAATLPLATGSGDKFEIIVGTTFTGSATVSCSGSDTFFGLAFATQDTGNAANAFQAAAGNNTITMDGTTRGGDKGDSILLTDIAAASWQVTMFINATGAEATPFSTV